MNVCSTSLPGVLIFTPQVFKDKRGVFQELYHQVKYQQFMDEPVTFVQDNASRSTKNVLRGLHFQRLHPQAKLISVVAGSIWDVAVDIDPASSTFRQYVAVELSAQNRRQLFIPAGYAHGFCVLSDRADVVYKCSDFYRAEDEFGLSWNDPDLAIEWPVVEPILSSKDVQNPTLSEFLSNFRPVNDNKDSFNRG